MNRKELSLILKEGEGYKIEFTEGFNDLVEKNLIIGEGATTARKYCLRQTSVNSGQLRSNSWGEKNIMTEINAMSEGWGTRIGRIFTDIFNPCVSASSAQSVSYRNPSIIDDDKKPQMNADERRYVPVTYLIKTTHRKGRKERKAIQQESLRPLRSLRLNAFSTPTPERAPPVPAVHLRLSRAGG